MSAGFVNGGREDLTCPIYQRPARRKYTRTWVKLYYKEVTWFLQPLSITFSSLPTRVHRGGRQLAVRGFDADAVRRHRHIAVNGLKVVA